MGRLNQNVLIRHVLELISPHKAAISVGLFLVLTNRAAALILPSSTKEIIDDVVYHHSELLLFKVTLAITFAAIIQSVSSYTLTKVVDRTAQQVTSDLRCRLYSHLCRLPLCFLQKHQTGELATRVISDVESVEHLVGSALLGLLGNLFTISAALLIMIRINALITLLTLSALVSAVVVMKVALYKLAPVFQQEAASKAQLSGHTAESINGIRFIKGYGRECKRAEAFREQGNRLLNITLNLRRSTGAMTLKSNLLVHFGMASVVYIGVHEIFAGRMSVGGLMTFSALVGYLSNSILQLSALGQRFTEALTGVSRTYEILTQVPELPRTERWVQLGPISEGIVVENLSFSYLPNSPVLRDISLRAPVGSVTALVGRRGSGKSTLIHLIAGFYYPDEGSIIVDHVDFRHVRLESFRSQLGLVLQEAYLFDGTLRDNVAFAVPNATSQQIVRACELAGVLEFAAELDGGLDARVGEGGRNLSGGQRQLVSLARAIAASPRLLLLDEPTSNLDSVSEHSVQHRLIMFLKEKRTTFIASHSLQMIKDADQILVLRTGKIVECGRHDDLISRRGEYYELFGEQANLELANIQASTRGRD